MSKTIKLKHGIEINLTDKQDDGQWGGSSIRSDLKENCTHCGQPECNHDCDGSQGADDEHERDDGRDQYNAAIDGFESLLLALAAAGADVESQQFAIAIDTAVDAIGNHFGE